jgi:tetratricopeptide (TPR) repeat protein
MQVHSAAGRHGEALAAFTEALPEQRKKDPAAAATTLSDAGVAHYMLKNIPAAREAFQMALELRQGALGEQHANTGLSHMQLGSILLELQRWQDAAQHSKAAAGILAEAFGATNQKTKTAMQNYKLARMRVGQEEAAEAEAGGAAGAQEEGGGGGEL